MILKLGCGLSGRVYSVPFAGLVCTGLKGLRIFGPRGVAGIVAIAAVALSTPSWSEPKGFNNVEGKVKQPIKKGNKTIIRQKSNRAVVEWSGFSIGEAETVVFRQPSAKSVILNRVKGKDPSNILGKLKANGNVTLVNPNGIRFGKTAKVDVAGLVATTANVSSRDFMDGIYKFDEPAPPSSYVVNQGKITVGSVPSGKTMREGGLAAFVAPWVVNSGTINARLGRVTLASGDTFTLDLFGDRLVQLGVKPTVMAAALDIEGIDATNALVTIAQGGAIDADGGTVILDAGTISLDTAAAKKIIDNAINMDGIIEARTLDTTSGRIVLNGGDAGRIRVGGTLDATASSNGKGNGEIVFVTSEPRNVELTDQATIRPAPKIEAPELGRDPNRNRSSEDQDNPTAAQQPGIFALEGTARKELQELIDEWLGEDQINLSSTNQKIAGREDSAEGEVTFLLENANFADRNSFGLYDPQIINKENVEIFRKQDPNLSSHFVEIFRSENKPGDKTKFSITNKGNVIVDNKIEGKFESQDFGYYLKTPSNEQAGGQRGGLFFSDLDLNPDSSTRTIHVGNFDIAGLTYSDEDSVPDTLQGKRQPDASRLLLWEDLRIEGLRPPEPDYNDFIVSVAAAGNVVPPPEVVEPPEVCGQRVDCVEEPLCPLGRTDCRPPVDRLETSPSPGPDDPWEKCESWRDDPTKTDVDVARCYAAIPLEGLPGRAKTLFAALASALNDPSPRSRARAARDLGRISTSLNSATSLLVGILASPDDEIATRAATIMKGAGEYADLVVPALTKVAKDATNTAAVAARNNDPRLAREEIVVARAALQGLGELGSYATPALPTFTDAFEQEDLGVRYHAANGITKVDTEMRATALAIEQVGGGAGNTPELIQELTAALRQDRRPFRRQAIDTLATIGPDARAAAPALAAELDAPDTRRQIVAVEDLGDINRFAAASVPVLVAALADSGNQPPPPGLTRTGQDPGSYVSVAATPLMGALDNPRSEVRLATTHTLRRLNSTVAATDTALQEDHGAGGRSMVGRITNRARDAIDEYDRQATEALRETLEKDDDAEVRRAAVQALGALGPSASDAVPDLIEAAKSGEVGLQIEAELALGQIGAAPETAVPTLVEALQRSDQPAVQYQAARALGLFGEEAEIAKPELQAAMREGDAALRYQAALALQTIDPTTDIDRSVVSGGQEEPEREVARLLSAVKDEDPEAVMTLSSIGPAAIPAVPDIVAAMKTTPGQGAELASLLTAISGEGLAEVPRLIEVLRTGESAARARAAERLGNISADTNLVVPVLIAGLEEVDRTDRSMRFALAEAIGDFGNSTTATTRALVAAASSDTSVLVRQEAQESLRQEARAALDAQSAAETPAQGPLGPVSRSLYEIDPSFTN